MRLLPDFRISPIVKPYVGGISKEFDSTLTQRIQDFDTAQEKDDLLSAQLPNIINNTTGFQGDVQVAESLARTMRNRINDRAKSGDYENMLRDTKNDSLEFATQLKPLQDRKEQYNQYIQSIKENEDLLDRQKNAAINLSQQLNDVPYDPSQGLKPLQFINPAKPVDIVKYLDDITTGIKANSGVQLINKPDGSVIEVNTDEITPERVEKLAKEIINSSGEIRDFISSEYDLGNNEIIDQEVDQAIESMKTKFGFEKKDISTFKSADSSLEDMLGKWVQHNTNPTNNPAYNNNSPLANGTYLDDDNNIRTNGNKSADRLSLMASSIPNTGIGAASNVGAKIALHVASFFDRVFTDNDIVDEESEEYNTILNNVIRMGYIDSNASREDKNKAVQEYMSTKDKGSITSTVSLNTNDKYKKTVEKILFNDENGSFNSGAAINFNFIDSEGNEFGGAKLSEKLEEIADRQDVELEDLTVSYNGSITDPTSPYEFGSSVISAGNEQLVMSPTEEDKNTANYFINRVNSSAYSNTGINRFKYNGVTYKTRYIAPKIINGQLIEPEKFEVTDLSNNESEIYLITSEGLESVN